VNRLLAPLLLAALAGPARAESPRLGSFQLQLGYYRPNIDAEFGGAAAPYRDVFGTGSGLQFRLALARSLFIGYGTLDLGLGAGWWSKSAKAFVQNTNRRSGDDTAFRILPLSLSLTYRFDRFADIVPIVPYGRASLERWQWWVTKGGGGTATSDAGASGSGATNGWSAAGGLALLLDYLDPTLAREMDRDIGINDTYLFLEVGRTVVKDFGSGKSWDLSPDRKLTWSGGILFVF